MKSVAIVAKGKNTCAALEGQLAELIGDRVNVRGYYIDGNIRSGIKEDLVVISSKVISRQAKSFISRDCPVFVARRSLNYNEIDRLFEVPDGESVLLVNDLLSSAKETISLLNASGINHIRFVPYFPGAKKYPKLEMAVTPGELELVPDFVKNVVDIKTRNIDVTTLVEILKALDLLDEKANLLSARYVKDIVAMLKKMKYMAQANSRMANQLQTIINTVHEGIIALDENNNFSVFNNVAEEITGVSAGDILGRGPGDDFPSKDVIMSFCGRPGEEKFINIRDRYIVVNASPIRCKDRPAGMLYTMKDVTEIQRLEEELRRKMRSRDACTRYTFDDIVGESEAIRNAVLLARKIAASSSPILIQGESGTGKELFAQAIHNASCRRKGPFVPVNFAALPESLIESELFGYEEGAFTGAKKGGMPGLFEQAHMGTIFLDEIGDAPLSFQVRLLRVLQEKQVRRIAGSRIIPVDVRVIAATNRDIKKLIAEGAFRQDLYYRLNVLPLYIPPLRERKKDILRLAEKFYVDFFGGKPPVDEKEYFGKVKDALLSYDWPGNARELQNTVEYLANISPSSIPETAMLPGELLRRIEKQAESKALDSVKSKLLREIARANDAKLPVGRRSLSRILGLTEGHIRKLLCEMKEDGMIKVNKGIKGIEILPHGRELINQSCL